jgi:small-conductance mechanosensitive channel
MIPKDATASSADAGTFPFIVSVILSLLLFGIYLWGHLLKRTMRILTSYLVETNKSGWELDWIKFRHDRYSAHTKPQTIIFLLLNIISIVFPFLLSWIYSLKSTSVVGPIFAVGVGIATGIFIYLMGFRSLFDDEAEIVERWKTLSKK